MLLWNEGTGSISKWCPSPFSLCGSEKWGGRKRRGERLSLSADGFIFEMRKRFASDSRVQHIGVEVSATRPADGAKFRIDADLLKVSALL